MMILRLWPLVPVSICGVLSGCATASAPKGEGHVHSLIDARYGSTVEWPDAAETRAAIDQRVAALLEGPLSPDSAVQIALLRNPRIQIEYARLGIVSADVLDASRLSNPTLSVSVLKPLSGNVSDLIAGGLSQSFSDLLLLEARKRLAAGEFERMQLLIADSLFDLIAAVRTAWYTAVGTEQIAAMRASVAKAAQTAAELARQFHAAGNISALQLAAERAAAAQAHLAATRAHADSTRARAALNELLGLRGQDTQWTITDRLATPVPQEDSPDSLLELARAKRLDLSAARSEVSLLEDSLSTTTRYRWMGGVDVGVAAERDHDGSRLIGPSLSLQLPIFNRGQGSIVRARGLLEERRAQLRALEVNIETEVRLGTERIQTAREIAEEYRSTLIPERENVVARAQENANYMLIGTFDLLLAKQQQYDAYQGYLEAVRDYWLARVDLTRTVGARLPSESAARAPLMGPEESPSEPSEGMHDIQDMNHIARRPASAPGQTTAHEGTLP